MSDVLITSKIPARREIAGYMFEHGINKLTESQFNKVKEDAGFIVMIKKGLFEELGAKEIKQQRKTEDLKADYEKKLENQKKLLTLEKEEALKEQKAKSKKELDEVKGQIELLQVELLETKEALKKAQKELKEKA